ncbi:MAG: hypothetical protein CL920_01640 [Deltaproteobacteria bacterium]|nr:hypothetical protein [Deltaproteobacteria bacterium]
MCKGCRQRIPINTCPDKSKTISPFVGVEPERLSSCDLVQYQRCTLFLEKIATRSVKKLEILFCLVWNEDQKGQSNQIFRSFPCEWGEHDTKTSEQNLTFVGMLGRNHHV